MHTNVLEMGFRVPLDGSSNGLAVIVVPPLKMILTNSNKYVTIWM